MKKSKTKREHNKVKHVKHKVLSNVKIRDLPKNSDQPSNYDINSPSDPSFSKYEYLFCYVVKT